MFVKIGSGIFNSEDIRAVLFENDEMTVYLKNVQEGEEQSYSVEKSPSDNSGVEKIVEVLNRKNEV